MIALDALHRDEGTVVLFEGFDPAATGPADRYIVAVDHRMAQDIADAIADGHAPVVDPEPWQIVGTIRTREAVR